MPLPRPRRPSLGSVGLLLALVVAACTAAPGGASPGGASPRGSSPAPAIYPVIVSSEQVVGDNRLLFSFLDPKTNQPIAAPDRPASVAFYHGDQPTGSPVATVQGSFLWAIPGSRGLYVTHVRFDQPGSWTAVFTTTLADGRQVSVPLRFNVLDKGVVLGIGDRAPAVKTPTLADVGGDVRKISTDPSPDPEFYRVSLDAALAAHQPIVLVFATPAFCTSGQCGPTLDIVKSVAAQEPGVTFINVEPYQLQFSDGRLQPVLTADGQLQPVPATLAYRLITEPWIFVIDRAGIIRGSFEGVVGVDELKAAIEAVK
jgi:hypothetical protein